MEWGGLFERDPMLRSLARLKDHTNDLNFATDRVARWATGHLRTVPAPHRVLDIGLGSARDLLAVKEAFCQDIELHGIESQPHWIKQANERGIQTSDIDIERQKIPADDEFFDVVIANHVIEHTKELFWIFNEISRVLKKGGIAIIGCPNLGSWHNRVALLLGMQPPCMKILGPHSRGITRPGFAEFIERGEYFELLQSVGSNLYPFPHRLNEALSNVVPGLCASMHFLLRRTEQRGSFLEVLDSGVPGIQDTPYFRGMAT